MNAARAFQATAVAIGARGVIILGPPGSGKSSLALALIDRGAVLIGDDSLMLRAKGGQCRAAPHPQTRGLIEIRGVGLRALPTCDEVALALAIRLSHDAPRLPETIATEEFCGIAVPSLALWPDSPVLALRAEAALAMHGLAAPAGNGR